MSASNLDFWKNIPVFKWKPHGNDLYRNCYYEGRPSSFSYFSSVFKMNGTNGLSWIFCLKYDDDKLSVYILLQSAERVPVTARYKMCLVNSYNEEVYSKQGQDVFHIEKIGIEQQDPKGFDEFITFAKIRQLRNSSLYSRVLYDLIPDWEFHCYVAVEPPSQRRIENINIPKYALLTDIENLLSDQEFSDLLLCVKGEEFHAHKAILAQRSPVFKAMFRSNMTEKKENKVIIEDIEPDAMSVVMKYIYTDDVDVNSSLSFGVLQAAEKYDLYPLKAACEKILAKALSIQNAIDILVTADKYNTPQLKAAAVDFISQFPEEVARTTQWDTVLKTRPDLIKLCLSAVFAAVKRKK